MPYSSCLHPLGGFQSHSAQRPARSAGPAKCPFTHSCCRTRRLRRPTRRVGLTRYGRLCRPVLTNFSTSDALGRLPAGWNHQDGSGWRPCSSSRAVFSGLGAQLRWHGVSPGRRTAELGHATRMIAGDRDRPSRSHTHRPASMTPLPCSNSSALSRTNTWNRCSVASGSLPLPRVRAPRGAPASDLQLSQDRRP